MVTLTGTVIWEDDIVVESAEVIATNGERSVKGNTNQQGTFSLVDLEPNKSWQLIVIEPKSETYGPTPLDLSKKADSETVHKTVELNRIEEEHSPRQGQLLLTIVLASLVLLIAIYGWTHNGTKTEQENRLVSLTSLSHSIENQIGDGKNNEIQRFFSEAESLTFESKTSQNNLSFDARRTLAKHISKLKNIHKTLISYAHNSDSSDDKAQNNQQKLDSLKNQAKTTLEELRVELDQLKVDTSFFWTEKPWWYLELWFWATCGILVQKASRIAWYLRIRSYHASATPLRIMLIIVTPILTVVAVQFLSIIKIENSEGIIFDVSKPETLALAAFLISLVPWFLQDYLRGLGESILKTKKE